jgi:hypothetical protein
VGDPLIQEPEIPEPPETKRARKLDLVFLLVTGTANAVWAGIGLVFWIPLLFRAALVSSARIVHSALTRQPPSYLRTYIRNASRFYLEGFWTGKDSQQAGTHRRHQLQVGRFLGEVAWAAAFYLVVLRLWDKERFAAVWGFLADLSESVWGWLRALLAGFVAWLPKSLPRLVDSGYVEWTVVVLVLLVAFLGGLSLGRRSRRKSR